MTRKSNRGRNISKFNNAEDAEVSEYSNYTKNTPNILPKKNFTLNNLKRITPLTKNQHIAFDEWDAGYNLVLEGWPGVGKSFLAMFLALKTILDPGTTQTKIVIVRSATQTRDIGFLKGSEEEKNLVYESPYMQICDQLFPWKNSYDNMKKLGIIEFKNTSFLRGTSWNDAVIIFDEYPNGIESELETVITRVGNNSRLIVAGDTLHQNDIGNKSGGGVIIRVLRRMESVAVIDFDIDDVVRSGFVKEFLISKYGIL